MAIKKIFKSSLPHLVYVTRKGKNLMFTNHKHITDNASDISELEDEIKSQHPHIFVDSTEAQIDTTLQDEIAAAQREAALGVMEKHARAALAAKVEAGGLLNQVHKSSELQVAKSGETVAVPADGNMQTGMSAAALLGVTTTASLAGLSKASNGK